MLVVCPCGTNLNLSETLVGKKVRCPVCKDVFLVQADAGYSSIKRQSLPTKQKQSQPLDEDEADLLEEYDEEQPRSVRNKGKRVTAEKSSLGLWRNIISTVILGALLIVLGIVLWTKFRGPGTVVLEFNVGGVTVVADGKQVEPSKEEARMGKITLTLSPGDHEVVCSKEGFESELRHFTIEPGSSGQYDIILRSLDRRKPNEVSPQGDLVVTAGALIDELGADDRTAYRKYLRRNVVVSGMVQAIQKVDLNAPGITVTLTGGDKGIEEGYVVCEFDNPTPATVKRIKLGQQIKVRGVCRGTGLRSMALVRVTLVEP